MKTLSFYVIAVVFTLVTACKKELIKESLNSNIINHKTASQLDTLIDSSFYYHNAMVSNIINSNSIHPGLGINNYVNISTYLCKSYIHDRFSIDSSRLFPPIVRNTTINNINNGTYIDTPNFNWVSWTNQLRSRPLMPNEEIALVDSLYMLLNQDYSGMDNDEIFSELSTRTNRLIDRCKRLKANGELGDIDGALAGTILSITAASIEFWKFQDIEDYPVPALIQIDAAGYLWGWGKSWWNDVNAGDYSTSWDDQKRRIGDGLLSAAEASSMGFLGGVKNWF